MLKSRPRVRVRVPSEIRAGDEFRATVILECRRPVDVGTIRVVLQGHERWTMGAGDSSVTRRNDFLRLGASLCDPRELPEGRTELSVRIPLPESAPPSYHGTIARIEYTLDVHVPIPWWPDRRASFEIHVAPPQVARLPDEPKIFSSNPSGPVGDEAHAEISLANTWTRVGDIVDGAVALSNAPHHRYSHIQVGLRGVETLYEGKTKRGEREYMRYRIRLGAEEALDGEMIPFRFRLPDDAMAELPWTRRPGGKAGLSSVRWEFEIVVGIRWESDLILRMPFRVLPASKRPGDAPARIAPPSIGSDRLRAVWEMAGRPHGLRYQSQTLSGRFGGTTLTIRRDHLGRSGIFIIAELSYPGLHLDLEVEPASAVQKVVGGGAQVGHPSWDRDHYVRARDANQAAELLQAIVPSMTNAILRRMDDGHLIVGVRAPGQSAARMNRFVGATIQLVRAFEAVRVELPPPHRMRGAVDAWRKLAGRLGGTLETARMRIEGSLGALRVEVRLAFDDAGDPLSTWLSVEPPGEIDREHELRITGTTVDPFALLDARFDGEVRELLTIIARGAHEVAIERGRVAVCLPTLLGAEGGGELPTIGGRGARALSPSIAEQRLSRLARLVALLRGHAGPYR